MLEEIRSRRYIPVPVVFQIFPVVFRTLRPHGRGVGDLAEPRPGDFHLYEIRSQLLESGDGLSDDGFRFRVLTRPEVVGGDAQSHAVYALIHAF